MAPPQLSLPDRLGIPRPLVLGYLGVLLFMVGDGVESGFIAPYMAGHGAGTEVHASYVITAYGVTVMLASWLSGALSDLWGPRRVMQLGLAVWVVFDVLFLVLALGPGNYPLMLVFYGLRGFGYPLFAFGFLVWITATAPAARMGTAVGWFYVAFTGGLPTLGSLVASGLIPHIGAYATLWAALVLVAAGGLIALLLVRDDRGGKRPRGEGDGPLTTLIGSVTILWRNPGSAPAPSYGPSTRPRSSASSSSCRCTSPAPSASASPSGCTCSAPCSPPTSSPTCCAA